MIRALKLLEACAKQGIPAVMLTAHAIGQESLMESIRKGAISYLLKETPAEFDGMLP